MKIEKEEIACYLGSYINLLSCAQVFPNKKIIEIFAELYCKGLIPLEPTIDNYNNMIQFYSIYCNIKSLAFLKDELYVGIDEKNLDDIEINDVDTINKTTIENYTKKEIILFVRNALSHNDKENPLYWFEHYETEDIRIHILLKNTKPSLGPNKGKPIPFELVLNQKSLNQITQGLQFTSKKRLMMGIGVKNSAARNYDGSTDSKNVLRQLLEETYYYRNFYKLLNHKENKKMETLRNENYINEYQEFLSSKLIEQKRKKLSRIQKNTLYKNILYWQESGNIIDTNEIFDYEMGKIIPLGIAKIDSLYLSRLRALSFLTGISYNDSTNMLIEGLCYNNPENVFNSAKYLFNSEISGFSERVKLGLLDEWNEMNLSVSIFTGYLLDSLVTENEIIIDNKSYSRERLRNSFVHGRWYISDDLKWELFDGKKSEFEFDWHKSIEIIKLKNYLVDFLNSRLNKNK